MTSNDAILSYRRVAFWTLTAVIVLVGALIFAPFLPALLWATILSVLTWPMYRRIRPGINDSIASFMTVMLTLLVIVIPLLLVGALVFLEISAFLAALRDASPDGSSGLQVHDLLRQVDAALKPLADRAGWELSVANYFEENRQEVIRSLTGPLGKFAYSFGFGLFTMIVALLTQFFMLRDGPRLRDPALRLMPFEPPTAQAALNRLQHTIVSVFYGVIVVAVVQSLLAGIAYAIAGVPSALVWTMATFVFCIVPFVGAPFVYVPVGAVLLAQGQVWQGLLVLCVGIGLVSQVDNLLRPHVIGTRVGFHYMLIFLGILGGLLLFGPVGLVAGPMVIALLLTLAELFLGNSTTATEEAEAS